MSLSSISIPRITLLLYYSAQQETKQVPLSPDCRGDGIFRMMAMHIKSISKLNGQLNQPISMGSVKHLMCIGKAPPPGGSSSPNMHNSLIWVRMDMEHELFIVHILYMEVSRFACSCTFLQHSHWYHNFLTMLYNYSTASLHLLLSLGQYTRVCHVDSLNASLYTGWTK